MAAAVRAGALSPVELVEEALDAARRLDPVLYFIDELDPDGARRTAERLEPTGALAGVPFLIKSRTPPESHLEDAVAVAVGRRVCGAFGWAGGS